MAIYAFGRHIDMFYIARLLSEAVYKLYLKAIAFTRTFHDLGKTIRDNFAPVIGAIEYKIIRAALRSQQSYALVFDYPDLKYILAVFGRDRFNYFSPHSALAL
jgi:hypothetical protein